MYGLNMGQNEEAYASNMLGGAASGAMTGYMMTGNPWGAAAGGVIGAGAGAASAREENRRREVIKRRYAAEARRRALLARQMAMSRGLSGGAAAGAESQGFREGYAPAAEMDYRLQQQQEAEMMQSLANLAMFYSMNRNRPAGRPVMAPGMYPAGG